MRAEFGVQSSESGVRGAAAVQMGKKSMGKGPNRFFITFKREIIREIAPEIAPEIVSRNLPRIRAVMVLLIVMLTGLMALFQNCGDLSPGQRDDEAVHLGDSGPDAPPGADGQPAPDGQPPAADGQPPAPVAPPLPSPPVPPAPPPSNLAQPTLTGLTYSNLTGGVNQNLLSGEMPTVVDFVFVGQGGLSGNFALNGNRRFDVTGTPGPGDEGQPITLVCRALIPGTSTNHPAVRCSIVSQFVNGAARFEILIRNGVQCSQAGPAAIQVLVDDGSFQSAPVQVVVNVVDACLPETKLLADDRERLDQMGVAVAIAGNYAVSIAPGDDGMGNTVNRVGAAYVHRYDGSTWSFYQKLYSSDGAADDNMSSVDICGDYIVLGASYHQTQGAAYVFENVGSQWNQIAKLIANPPNPPVPPTPPIPSGGAEFGTSVAFDDTCSKIAVGSPGDAEGSSRSGAVYIYSRQGSSFTQLAKIKANPIVANGAFGTSVDLEQNLLVVGAPMALLFEPLGPGQAYVFTENLGLWNQSELSRPQGLNVAAKFGSDVAISSGKIVVGSMWATRNNISTGLAYLYQQAGGTWNFTEIRSPDSAASDEFGTSVAIQGQRIVIGAPKSNSRAGSIYLYQIGGSGWQVQPFKVMARIINRGIEDQFGYDVSLSSNRVMAGARLDDEPDDSTGSAFILDWP